MLNPPKTIDLLIPTRGRPNNLKPLLENVRATASESKNITVCFWADRDDLETARAAQAAKEELGDSFREIVVLNGDRQGIAHVYNEMANWVNGDLLGYLADDVEFRTDGWDKEICKAFGKYEDRIALVHCMDPARPADAQFPDHGFISRWARNVSKCVFFCFPPHPDLPGSEPISFTDILLSPIYESMERRVHLPEVVLAHKHWCQRGDGTEADAEIDANYAMHAILSRWKKDEHFEKRVSDLTPYINPLKKWLRFVEKGGLAECRKQGWNDE